MTPDPTLHQRYTDILEEPANEDLVVMARTLETHFAVPSLPSALSHPPVMPALPDTGLVPSTTRRSPKGAASIDHRIIPLERRQSTRGATANKHAFRRSYPIIAAVLLSAMIVVLVLFVRSGRLQFGSPPQSTGGLVTSACGSSPVPLTLPSGAFIQDFQMLSPEEGWLIGGITVTTHSNGQQVYDPLIMHFLHCHWTQVHLALHGFELFDLNMLSPNDGWALGGDLLTGSPHSRAVVVRYHAGQWQVVTIPAVVETHADVGYEYDKLVMTSPEDGWIVAQTEDNNGITYVLRLQHGAWSVASHEFAQAVWKLNGVVIQGGTIWGFGSTGFNINAVGEGSKEYPTIGRFVNNTWQPEHLPASLSGLTGSIYSVSALSPSDIWAVGQGPDGGSVTAYRPLVLHYDGKTWSRVLLPDGMQSMPWSTNSLVMVSSHEGWIWGTDFSHDQSVGESLLLHYLNGSWQRVTSLPKDISGGGQSTAFGGETWGIGSFIIGTCANNCSNDEAIVLLHLYQGQWQITGRIQIQQNP